MDAALCGNREQMAGPFASDCIPRRKSIMRHALLVLLVGVNALTLKAEHQPLLPQPQQIQYGAGRLSLGGLSINLVSDPAPEDQFAEAELSAFLSRRAGRTIPVAM